MTEFHWQQAAGKRHAVDTADQWWPPRPGEEITTLCGLTTSLTRDELHLGIKPTCQACDDEWRRREGLPRNPFYATR